jgi:hypothetical protein
MEGRSRHRSFLWLWMLHGVAVLVRNELTRADGLARMDRMPTATRDRDGIYRQMLNALLLEQYRQLHRLRRDLDAEPPASLGARITAHVAGDRRLLDTLAAANEGDEAPPYSDLVRVVISALDNVDAFVGRSEVRAAIELSVRIFDLISLAVQWRRDALQPGPSAGGE